MDKLHAARAVLAAIELGDIDTAARYLADDAVCVGAVPQPLGKEMTVGVMRALCKGMPDWRFNARNWQTRGAVVGVDMRVTATQTKVLPAVLPTVPPVLATGRHIALPDEHLELIFRDEKIVRIELTEVDGGGVRGVLRQLGIEVPLAA